jgi:Cap4 SAVED domain
LDELGVDIQIIINCFPHTHFVTYDLVRVSNEHARMWADDLKVAIRRCYVTDAALDSNARRLGVHPTQILSAKLPDAGSTMAGDFGEIVTYLYHVVRENPKRVFGPKKWRLKQDRTKPAPHSDVVQFVLPMWPLASQEDVLLCSEVKTKSTAGASAPISSAIEDCAKDRTSRLARTLVWLRERAMGEDLGAVNTEQLNRFINAIDYPPAKKCFYAVAIICSTLLDSELVDAPLKASAEYSLIIITIPDLKTIYTSVFESVHRSVASGGSQ